MELTFFWISFVAYCLATILHIGYLAFQHRTVFRAAVVLMGAGMVSQTIAFGIRTAVTGHLPLTNLFEYITLLAWFSGLTYLLSVRYFKMRFVEAVAGPLVFMLYISASLFPKTPSQQLLPALQSIWLQIHVTMAAAGEAAFLVAFAASVLYFPASRKRSKRPDQRSGLPSPASLDETAYRFIIIGYPLFTMGALFAGAVWAYRAWGRFWSWDPKETCSLVVWLIYSFYLHARLVRGWRGKRTAWLSIFGFLAALFTFFSNLILGGLHAYT